MLGKWATRLASNSTCGSYLARLWPRRYASRAPILKGDALGPTRVDGHHTVRLRKDGNGKELPIPPRLDPVVLGQQYQWKTPKAQPNHTELSLFQKKLQANVYAHTIASPVRKCRALAVELPEDLLTTLHVRPNAETRDPWLLPVSLTTDAKHLGYPYRFLSRYIVASNLSKKKNWMKGLYSRMIGMIENSNIRKLVWREDMPDLILSLMRKQTHDKLRWFFGSKGRLIPVPSPRSQDIDKINDVSSVLLVRSLRTRADDVRDHARDIIAEIDKCSAYFSKSFSERLDPHAYKKATHPIPNWYGGPIVPRLQARAQFPELEYMTTTWRGKKVALYSLTDLLTAEITRDLMQRSKYEEHGCLVMKQARHNVPIELLLSRLQAYVAQPGP